MRSIFLFFASSTAAQIADALSASFEGQRDPWIVWHAPGDPAIYAYVRPPEELAWDMDPVDVAHVEERLDGKVSVWVEGDVSGRHPGRPEALALTQALLPQYGGIAGDDSGSLWDAEEIAGNARVDGRLFFSDD